MASSEWQDGKEGVEGGKGTDWWSQGYELMGLSLQKPQCGYTPVVISSARQVEAPGYYLPK